MFWPIAAALALVAGLVLVGLGFWLALVAECASLDEGEGSLEPISLEQSGADA